MQNKKINIKGFTLIELIIVVAIIAILSSIAYVSYSKYVQRTNRKAALAQMHNVAQQLERFYTVNNGSYTDANPNIPKVKGYSISFKLIGNDGQRYRITAELNGNGDPDCGDLSIDSLGTQESSKSSSGCFR